MGASFEGETESTQLERWDIAQVDFDDPSAPRIAILTEITRVTGKTDFIGLLAAHPEYDEATFQVLGNDKEVQYQIATQICNIIVSQLRDNPETKLSVAQCRLVTAVLALPKRTLTTETVRNLRATILAADEARTRCMRVITLAAACRTSLRALPEALKSCAAVTARRTLNR